MRRLVHAILDDCFDQHVAFFFKQWGGPRPKSAGRLLDGALYDTIPERLDDGSYFIPLPTGNHNLDAAVRRREAFLRNAGPTPRSAWNQEFEESLFEANRTDGDVSWTPRHCPIPTSCCRPWPTPSGT